VRDVCVIGGGSAGTYAAVQLKSFGKSVVVLEKLGRLGGHAQTIFVNNVPIDIGVQAFDGDNPLVASYAAQLGVPLAPLSFTSGLPPAANVDFHTGASVAIPPLDPVAFGTAFGTYFQILQTQFPYLDSGFNLPNPVPPDLLLSFGDFATKYGLDPIVMTAFQFGQGIGDLLKTPALYVLKLFSLTTAGAIATNAFLHVPTGNATLYDAAAGFLGADVIVDAHVVAAARRPGVVEVLVETPNGPVVVQAGKLVVAIPPTLLNLAPLIPDVQEISLFDQFHANYYATSLVQVNGLPPYVGINAVAANTRDNLPVLPGLYGLEVTALPGYYVALYGSTCWIPDEIVKADIVKSVNRLGTSGTFPGASFGSFITFSSHAPFEMMVSTSDIAGGFYSRLNALQGHRSTYYTGAAFQTNDSSLIWRFTAELLPQLLA
jgi:hypothetical protein